jgi:hypothetical protein
LLQLFCHLIFILILRAFRVFAGADCGANFTLTGLRLYNPHEMQHRLLYAANFREVLAEKLEKYLPNLQKKRLTEPGGEKFVYLGFVEGEYLDQHVNGERTNFTWGFRTMPISVPGHADHPFRDDGDHDSGMMPITRSGMIPIS